MIRPTRILVNIKATYTLRESEYPCEIEDLSMSGLCIRTRQILEVGDLLRISLLLESNQIVFFTVIRNKDLKELCYGLEIEEMSNAAHEILDDFLKRMFEERNKEPTEEYHSHNHIISSLR